LRYQPPYAWTPLIGFLAARAIPGVEAVSDDLYRRVFDLGGACGHLAVRHRPERNQIQLDAWVPGHDDVPREVIARIKQVFDVAADPGAIAAHFAEDGTIGPRARSLPGLRVPGAWDLFELGVRAILGQQVTVKGASTLSGRLVSLCGRPVASDVPGLSHVFPRPEALAAADLSQLGVPKRRRESLRVFAAACASGAVSAGRADLDEVLLGLPGFGDWTVQYMLMRACSDPDAFPASDLWLRRTAGETTVKALLERAEAWRPFRAYAAVYLWQEPAT
jgi:AraC family transcriptional regulator, regulatory protein of adaptative response / DNA-3-methyladenine glycosylase II